MEALRLLYDFPHSFSITRIKLRSLLNLDGLGEPRETRTPAVTLPAGVAFGQYFFKKRKRVIYTLFNVIFCNIAVVLFFSLSFFLIQYFEETLASPECTHMHIHMHTYVNINLLNLVVKRSCAQPQKILDFSRKSDLIHIQLRIECCHRVSKCLILSNQQM